MAMRRRLVENARHARFGRDEAVRLRETFTDKEPESETTFSWSWPKTMTHIGEAFAVMYRSDKWKRKGDFENYKHICESRVPWKLFAAPGLVLDGVTLHGETHDLPSTQMPDTFAMLANCLGVQCRLFQQAQRRNTAGVARATGDEGIYEVQISRAKLGSGRTKSGKLFLCVYVENEGPKLIIFGTELDVEKDGIVG